MRWWWLFWAGLSVAQQVPPTDPTAETEDAPRAWGPEALDGLPPTYTDQTVTQRGEVPDYDGREKPPPTAGEVLAWVPRVVFAPVYLVERYLVYPPVRAVAIWTEKNNIPVRVTNALSFGDTFRFTIVPSALIDFGFRPSVGLALAGRELTRADHRMSLKAAYGGNGWTALGGGYQIPLSPAARASTHPLAGSIVSAQGWYLQRPDYIFHGIGTDATEERTRFGQTSAGGELALDVVFGEMDGVRLRGSVSQHDFDEGRSYQDDPLITERFDTAAIQGFDGYLLVAGGGDLVLDTGKGPPGANNGVPAPGSAVRLEGSADLGLHTHDGGPSGRYLRWHGEVGAFVDLNGRNRTIAVRQFASAASQLGDGAPIPFAELVTLGGNETMRGHLQGRFRGESALGTGVQYSWPIWVVLNGSIEAELGGVFGPDFDGAGADAMAASFAYGLRTPRNHDGNTQIMVGLGTAPLGNGFYVDTIRLVLGTTEGF